MVNLNLEKLKVTWTSSQNNPTVIQTIPELLQNGIIKLTIQVNKDEPEGKAKIRISTDDDKNILAESEINIIKPQSASGIKGVRKFAAPIIIKHSIVQNPKNKELLEIKITGENFIGKRANINNKKIVVSKKNKDKLSLTIAEFRNPDILITRTYTTKKNTELTIKVRLPNDYKSSKEDLFISTPVGQTYIQIQLPKGKQV